MLSKRVKWFYNNNLTMMSTMPHHSGGAWNLECIPVERADQGADDDNAYEFGTPHKVTVHDTLISNSQAVLKGHFDKHNKQFGHLRTGHRSTLPRDGGKVTGGETFHEVTFWMFL